MEHVGNNVEEKNSCTICCVWHHKKGWVLFINFMFMWPCIVTNFFVIKPTRCTNFTNLFYHETLHVSDSSSVHHQEFIYCTLSIGICHRGSILVLLESSLQTCMTYTMAECTVNKLLMMDRQTVRSCRVSCQNKFVKLVHLVGFITEKFVHIVEIVWHRRVSWNWDCYRHVVCILETCSLMCHVEWHSTFWNNNFCVLVLGLMWHWVLVVLQLEWLRALCSHMITRRHTGSKALVFSLRLPILCWSVQKQVQQCLLFPCTNLDPLVR